MPPEAVRPETPSGASGESVDALFLQDRLRLFGAILFLIAAAFYVVGLLLARLAIQPAFSPVGHAALWAILLLTGGTWLGLTLDAIVAGDGPQAARARLVGRPGPRDRRRAQRERGAERG